MTAELAQIVLAAWSAESWRDLHVLAAVSGGVDSVALAAGLAEAKRQVGGRGELILAHVNHQLRGADSDRQERWVREFAERLGLPVVVAHRCVAQRASQDGDGLEAAARQERYAALLELAEAAGARYVAVAHTRDDQAETVVMRLLRGAGLRGLGGMRRTRILGPMAMIIRPVLDVPRLTLQAAVERAGLAWFHDASNDDRRFTRNRVRHELLPALRAAAGGREFDASICELAAEAQTAADWLESAARQALAASATDDAREPGSPAPVNLDVATLAGAASPLRTEILRVAWRDAGLGEQAMTRRHWLELAQLAEAGAGASLNLPGDLRASVSSGRLVIERMR